MAHRLRALNLPDPVADTYAGRSPLLVISGAYLKLPQDCLKQLRCTAAQ